MTSGRPHLGTGDARYPEVDWVKAVAILAVVWIHAQRAPWDPGVSPLELWLGHVTRFAVPGFLAASGYLYALAGRPDAATTRRRLARIGAPYLVFSVAAQLFHAARGAEPTLASLAWDLLFGASFGPYYYVPQIALFVLLTPLLFRLPRAAWLPLTACALVAQGVLETGSAGLLPLFWHIRNPLLWAGYFLVGFCAGAHRERVVVPLAAHRGAFALAGGAVLLAGSTLPGALGTPRLELHQLGSWLGIHGTLAALLAVSCARDAAPRAVRILSDATYAIYLGHLFFVIPVKELLPLAPHRFTALPPLTAWLAGLLGSLAVVALARRLLGDRSRLVTGA